jgi:signal transduction histidine kinase
MVEVRDAGGRRTGTSGSGRGLAGLRERVSLYDGELEYGPDGDGFSLRARLPVR